MDYAETQEQKMIRESVSQIAEDYDWEYWRDHVDEQTFPMEYWDDLAEGGWLGVTIPEEYGGGDLGMLEMSIVVEELSRGGGQAGIIFVLTPVFGGITIERHGTTAQKERYLPAIASGDMKFCMGLTEAGAGTNSLNIDTFAESTGDGYEVSGQKMFISGVENAGAMLLITRTSPLTGGDPAHGITVFIVDDPAERDGVSLTPLDLEVPWYETQYQVDIDGLELTEEDILGSEDTGLYLLWDTLNTERIAGAASVIGGGLRAIDIAVDYANERAVFGQPIGAHQAVQHPLAEAYSRLLCAREITYKAAWQFDNGEGAGMAANAAKLQSSQAATQAADRAIQTLGGNGFAPEYEVYTIWQNVRLTKTIPVTNEMARNFIAEHHLGLPRSY